MRQFDLVLVIPLAGVLVLAAVSAVFFRRFPALARRERASAVAWTLSECIPLLLVAVWGALVGPVDIGVRTVGAFTLVLTLLGCAVPLRAFMRAALARTAPRPALVISALRDAVVLVAVCVLGFLAVEIPWNDNLPWIGAGRVLVNLALIALAFCILYALGQRTGVLVAVGVAALGVIGIAQHYVSLFKGAAIMPSDLTALSTAAEVGVGYEFELVNQMVVGLCLVGVAWALLAFVTPLRPRTVRARRVNLGANLAASVALAVCLAVGVATIDLCSLGFIDNYWVSLDPYRQQGFVGSFVTLLQRMGVVAPDGYREEDARADEQELAAAYDAGRGSTEERLAAEVQFDELKPTVITIMNESFADLSIFNGLGVGYTGPAGLRSLADAALVGMVSPSVLGGGTCNSEFEYLTGASMGFLDQGVYAYTTYSTAGIDCLAKQFAAMGYDTTAIHPAAATNWNRDTVYRDMGFDTFVSLEDFDADAAVFHSGISDAAMYEKVLEQVEQADSPQFIMGITMQNHGGYDIGDIPEEVRVEGSYADLDDYVSGETNEYLSCIEESDRALTQLIDRLRALDKPVVLVFFGDHQPSFTPMLNDALSPDADELTRTERLYQTPYLIWTNYDLAGSAQVSTPLDCGSSALGALVLDTIGAPLSDYQKAQIAAMGEVPVLNGLGYRLADGSWHALDDDQRASIVDALADVHYLEIGSKL